MRRARIFYARKKAFAIMGLTAVGLVTPVASVTHALRGVKPECLRAKPDVSARLFEGEAPVSAGLFEGEAPS